MSLSRQHTDAELNSVVDRAVNHAIRITSAVAEQEEGIRVRLSGATTAQTLRAVLDLTAFAIPLWCAAGQRERAGALLLAIRDRAEQQEIAYAARGIDGANHLRFARAILADCEALRADLG